MLEIFLILFRSWVINKNGFSECVFFASNSRSKQNKTNPEHPFVDIDK